MSSVSEQSLIVANESDQLVLQEIEEALDRSKLRGDLQSRYADLLLKLVNPNGDEIELPLVVFEVLRQIVSHLALGKAVSIVPVSKELSIQEAANLLNVSRSYLISLLESGRLPFVQMGTHQHILFSDLIEYKKRRDEEKRQGLAEILHISEDEGLYD